MNNNEQQRLESAVEDIIDDATAQRLFTDALCGDVYELRHTMTRMRQDHIGLRHDIAALRNDLADGFATLHSRLAVVHRDMAGILALLEQCGSRNPSHGLG